MAVPKKKMSRSRTRRRKAQWKVAKPTLSTCPPPDAVMSPMDTMSWVRRPSWSSRCLRIECSLS